jgi:hypothetical protein
LKRAALTYAILNTAPLKPASQQPELPPLLDEIVMNAIPRCVSIRLVTLVR